MNLPQYITDRRQHCPNCPNATRSAFGGSHAVTLNDSCTASQPALTIRTVYETPGFGCPVGRFKAVQWPVGHLTVQNGRITGWKEGSGCGC